MLTHPQPLPFRLLLSPDLWGHQLLLLPFPGLPPGCSPSILSVSALPALTPGCLLPTPSLTLQLGPWKAGGSGLPLPPSPVHAELLDAALPTPASCPESLPQPLSMRGRLSWTCFGSIPQLATTPWAQQSVLGPCPWFLRTPLPRGAGAQLASAPSPWRGRFGGGWEQTVLVFLRWLGRGGVGGSSGWGAKLPQHRAGEAPAVRERKRERETERERKRALGGQEQRWEGQGTAGRLGLPRCGGDSQGKSMWSQGWSPGFVALPLLPPVRPQAPELLLSQLAGPRLL